MLGLFMSIASIIMGSILCFAGEADHGFLLFLIGGVWHLSFHLSAIHTKLKEIQEGLYAEFAIKCGLVSDMKKEVKE